MLLTIKMSTGEDYLLGEQVEVLYSFCASYIYFKRIEGMMKLLCEDGCIFWIKTMNAHLINSIIDWCHVFGQPKSSKIHWHKSAYVYSPKCSSDDEMLEKYKDEIRKTIREPLSWSDGDLTSYVKGVVKFRNKYAGHRDIGEFPDAPHMDRAYVIANAYLSWLQQKLKVDNSVIRTLDDCLGDFTKEVDGVLTKCST